MTKSLQFEKQKTHEAFWTFSNNWGFPFHEVTQQGFKKLLLPGQTLGLNVKGTERPNGALQNLGPIGFGAGVAVGTPVDPVSIFSKVGVDFGKTGLAGYVPFGFTNQGEHRSLNDYDGNKLDIVPDRNSKHANGIPSKYTSKTTEVLTNT
ncbi:unnamed protein product [Thelazia callipaeda]|uniref:Ntox43 domain-containing protein n=1 Tax=Thelazia callipaeda TaxID=103827 RepID=A0A0N5CXM1_THECL|nr:unnamed protein product [Thelazia callipaeda]